ncbi:MAG TPA: hypothetical protein PLM25_03475 [Limnochordia bacterium]|nr:hypothetical protein [Limnochordia bacterium]
MALNWSLAPLLPWGSLLCFTAATLPVESVTRVVQGEGGARLFARQDGGIDRVFIFGGADFAIAQVRYHCWNLSRSS